MLHHLDFNEMIGEKATWKIYKETALSKSWKQHCHKAAAVQTLTFYLTNHPNKMNKICWINKDKLKTDIPL